MAAACTPPSHRSRASGGGEVNHNLIWLVILVIGGMLTWYVPYQYAVLSFISAYVFGTWWGYLTALKEEQC